jgi:hypothetical protein
MPRDPWAQDPWGTGGLPEPEEEALWDPPPPLLPDGSGPWMQGPDAIRIMPQARSGRFLIRALFTVLIAVGLGAAVWAVLNAVTEDPPAEPAPQVTITQIVTETITQGEVQ